jgi:hypothetical protein
MKKESPSLDELNKWGICLLKCIKHIGHEKPDEKLLHKVIHSMEAGLLHYYANGSIKKLKSLVHEIELWALELDPHDFEVVNKMVFKEFGKNICEENFFKKIEKVIKKGQIKTENEYRLLNELLNIFSDDASKKEMIEKATELIFSFEVKLNKQKKLGGSER